VSKKVDYVIVGDSPGSKLQKAEDLKKNGHPIEIIDVIKLQKIIDE
jgi:NAD-dependent DNA ligase